MVTSDWFSQIIKKTQPTYDAIYEHPFIQQALDGTLDNVIFEFYIRQTLLSYNAYKKLLANIAIKCQDNDDCRFYLKLAIGATDLESMLQESYIDSSRPTIITPTSQLYTGFLSSVTHSHSVGVAMAAALSGSIFFKKMNDCISGMSMIENNPYQHWVDLYHKKMFADEIERAIEIVNRHANAADQETRTKMSQAFTKGSKLKWMLLDSAYKQEQWII